MANLVEGMVILTPEFGYGFVCPDSSNISPLWYGWPMCIMGYLGSLSGLVNGQKIAVFQLFLGFRTWLILLLIKLAVIYAWCIRLVTGYTTIKWYFYVGLVCHVGIGGGIG